MKVRRVLASWLLVLVAALALLFGIGYGQGVRDTVEHSRQIYASFKSAAAYVDAYTESNGELPSSATFETWTRSHPSSAYGINGIRLERPANAPEMVAVHGPSPKNGYLLSYWRGEWEETYVSWTKKSTLELEESAYFAFRSRLIHTALTFLVLIGSVIAFFKLWRGDEMRPNWSVNSDVPAAGAARRRDAGYLQR